MRSRALMELPAALVLGTGAGFCCRSQTAAANCLFLLGIGRPTLLPSLRSVRLVLWTKTGNGSSLSARRTGIMPYLKVVLQRDWE